MMYYILVFVLGVWFGFTISAFLSMASDKGER